MHNERCLSGSEGGPEKPSGRKADRALRSDPTWRPNWRCIAAVAGILAPALPAAADERELNAQLNSLEAALSDSFDRIKSLESIASGLEVEVEGLEEGMLVHAQAERERRARLANVERRLTDLDGELHSLDSAANRDREILSAALGALARLGRQPLAAPEMSPAAAIAAARSDLVLGAAVNELVRRNKSRQVERGRAAESYAQAAKDKELLAHVASVLTSDQLRINELLARKSAERRDALAEHRRASIKTKELAREADDLRNLLERLANVGPVPSPPPRKPAPPSKLVANSPSADRFVRNSFAEARGTLPMPVSGSLSSTFGDIMAGGERSKGITVETAPDTRVITPYDGLVVFVGPFRAYGQLLIIQHGEGYHMLLAGFSRIDSVLDQWLLAGEPVGSMGHPADGKPTLYIELRRSGIPINPLPWLTSDERKASG